MALLCKFLASTIFAALFHFSLKTIIILQNRINFAKGAKQKGRSQHDGSGLLFILLNDDCPLPPHIGVAEGSAVIYGDGKPQKL